MALKKVPGGVIRTATITRRHSDGHDEKITLPAARARELEQGKTGNLTEAAFIEAHRIRAPEDAAPPPRPGDQWHCGNGHLRAQAVLAMLQGLSEIDAALIEALDGLFYEAGPDFAQQQINDAFRVRMPF